MSRISSFVAVGLSGLSGFLLVAGCGDPQDEQNTGLTGSDTASTSDGDSLGSSGTGTTGSTTGAESDSASTDGIVPRPLPFSVSNIPSEFDAPFDGVGDIMLNREFCGERAEINTDSGLIKCFAPDPIETNFGHFVNTEVLQEDGSPLTLIVANNVHVGLDLRVTVFGSRPLVLVAISEMSINGIIDAQDSDSKFIGHAGGASEPPMAPAQGQGLGGGAANDVQVGAGGASYCGMGGKGGDRAEPQLVGALGGPTYGQPSIVPLVGGSSGGRAGNHSGAGGGAIQLVAGSSFKLGASGSINVGGLGGGWQGNGGGSGGAVLIESSSIVLAGTVAANGGGGGGGGAAGTENGNDGTPDAVAAMGGVVSLINYGIGGDGSFGDQINGSAGSNAMAQGGGGGGGSGWIRLNSFPEMITINGVLSPSVASGCASVGFLNPQGAGFN